MVAQGYNSRSTPDLKWPLKQPAYSMHMIIEFETYFSVFRYLWWKYFCFVCVGGFEINIIVRRVGFVWSGIWSKCFASSELNQGSPHRSVRVGAPMKNSLAPTRTLPTRYRAVRGSLNWTFSPLQPQRFSLSKLQVIEFDNSVSHLSGKSSEKLSVIFGTSLICSLSEISKSWHPVMVTSSRAISP